MTFDERSVVHCVGLTWVALAQGEDSDEEEEEEPVPREKGTVHLNVIHRPYGSTP